MLKLALALLLAAQTAATAPAYIYKDASADQTIRKAMHATYSMDLVEARRNARALQKTFPDHPVGFVLDAETYWWEAQADPTRAEIEEEYSKVQDTSIDIGEKALKAKKYPVVEIKAYLASAWGSKARFRLTQHGVGWSTVRDGQRAHGYAEEVFKADPNYTDILVGIGAYNYFTGKIPAVLKPFAILFGARGNATLGLQQISSTIEKGIYAQTEARIVLFTALMKDEQYAKSMDVLKVLMTEYPNNYALYAWAGQWYRDQEKFVEGADYFEKLAVQKQPISIKLAQYALFQKAVMYQEGGRSADARTALTRLRALGVPDPALTRTIVPFEKKLKR